MSIVLSQVLQVATKAWLLFMSLIFFVCMYMLVWSAPLRSCNTYARLLCVNGIGVIA